MKEVFRHSGVPISWEEFNFANDDDSDKEMLEKAINSIKRNGVAVKG